MVRQLLEAAGILTIDADSIGRAILRSDGPAYAEVVKRWPRVVQEGEIHRPSLASIVFNDPDELAALEGITHPHIFDIIGTRVDEIDSTVVVEIPVLNHGLGDEWQRIVVDCHDEMRLQRAIARGMGREDAKSRMAAQPRRDEWLAVADLIVPNHGSLDELEETTGRLASSGVLTPRPDR